MFDNTEFPYNYCKKQEIKKQYIHYEGFWNQETLLDLLLSMAFVFTNDIIYTFMNISLKHE